MDLKKIIIPSLLLVSLSSQAELVEEAKSYKFTALGVSPEILENTFKVNHEISGDVSLSSSEISLGNSLSVNWTLNGSINNVSVNGNSQGGQSSGSYSFSPTTSGSVSFLASNSSKSFTRSLNYIVTNWVQEEPIYTQWTVSGSATSHTEWTPIASTQKSNFTQSRDYTVPVQRTKTDRERDTINGGYRNEINTVENSTELRSESRSVAVSNNGWNNSGSPYSCSSWSPDPSTIDSGQSFTQNRSCNQDQDTTWSHIADSLTIHSFLESRTTTINESQSATGTKPVLDCRFTGPGNNNYLWTRDSSLNGYVVYWDNTVVASGSGDPTQDGGGGDVTIVMSGGYVYMRQALHWFNGGRWEYTVCRQPL